MKKKLIKEKLITFFVYAFIFLGIYFVLTNTKYIFGSTIDFKMQHYIIPEYFRTLFYETGDLFPDFALNLSGGINIFYLSYYGFLSPIILLSYLFPFVSMLHFIIISTSFIAVVSAFLMYCYLRKNGFQFFSSFVGGLCFLLASPVIFHSHRHIMFMNYMPFLLMGMYGVDKYFKSRNGVLLCISIFLMIMTSYYYSVGGIVVLFLLGVYWYLKENKFVFKSFFANMIRFSIPFIIGVLLGMIIILPTLYTLFSGREKGNVSVSLLSLFLPSLDFKNILYSAYSTGVSVIAVVSSVYFLLRGKSGERFLSIVLLLIGIFPIFNYVLNGTLYIDPKSLIPFLPLLVLSICMFIEKLVLKDIDYSFVFSILFCLFFFGVVNFGLIKCGFVSEKLSQNIMYLVDLFLLFVIFILYRRFFKKGLLIGYFLIFLVVLSLGINLSDKLMLKGECFNDKEVVKEILSKDDGFYRMNNFYLKDAGLNKIYDTRQLSSTIYSSAFNRYYNQFYYDIFNNPVTYRNRSMTAPTNNILFHNYMGEKYILTNKDISFGYPSVVRGDVRVYQNKDAFSIGYATSNVLSKSDYEQLIYPSNIVNLMKNAIVSDEVSNVVPDVLEKVTPDYSLVDSSNLEYEKTENGYQITSLKNGKLKIKINHDMTNKVLFIRFKNHYDPACSKNDLAITINGIMNKLTCKSWKYHNGNFVFDYSIYQQGELDITFAKGFYDLSDFEFYLLDYSSVKNLSSDVDKFAVDKNQTVGDVIEGDISVSEDGYFVIQIPYDKGFVITVDNEAQDYENVNDGLIGFKISKGNHHIRMEYKAPFKTMGIVLSLIGLTFLFIYSIIVVRRSRRV